MGWPLGISVESFLDCWLIWDGPAHVAGGLGLVKKAG